uniref:Transmembrane protein 200A n=1 Tax=Cyprinus carpio TaxID=7962 RepID=A0A8C2GXP4_CYPCA
MIATGGVITGLAALKRQDSTRSQYHLPTQSPTPAPEKKCTKRKPRADVVVVRGKIRLYSASGFFLVLGVLILLAGIAMAVLGYWPHKDHQKAPESKLSVHDTQVGRQQVGSIAQFLEQHLHSEKMKMLGPFTMGIGIFIFICANAILHENRDRETKIIHMRDMYSTVIDIHSLRIKEQKCTNGAYVGPYADTEIRSFGLDSQFASRLAANTLMSFSGLDRDVRFSHRTKMPNALHRFLFHQCLHAACHQTQQLRYRLQMLSAHSKSLDLERGPTMLTVQPEQRKHPSWPRLDRSNTVLAARCSKLKNLVYDCDLLILMTLIRSRLQGRKLKPFSCAQV